MWDWSWEVARESAEFTRMAQNMTFWGQFQGWNPPKMTQISPNCSKTTVKSPHANQVDWNNPFNLIFHSFFTTIRRNLWFRRRFLVSGGLQSKLRNFPTFLTGDQTVRLVFRNVLDYKLYIKKSNEKSWKKFFSTKNFFLMAKKPRFLAIWGLTSQC